LGFLGFFVVFQGATAFAHVAQLAEHILGKDEVISSILIMGSSFWVGTKQENYEQ
jgi:hypothetical protein